MYLVSCQQRRWPKEFRDASERLFLPRLGRGKVEGADEVVVAEAGVGARPEQGLDRRDMAA